ncbi:extradiol ring-cleavage dioxygenase [Sphingobium indicum]|uniref:Extradiol ring-cleavage dioxygenase n=4 Tax=Sphingobium indicum TaxID=332055 RepID=A0A1L5BTD4_SPHIB|nr:extradiol ring-cleavage dioxygenase [Sphingobium indicum]APL96130.1 extradiol ring-cleavage dioxygenase [Sphingobium indicum B90A]KEY99575.1 extradiol ring-cleavage dioxygenase [Sphingomonas sp. BHC-A]RYL99215.1 extradiol ring-cleavage dioxygenase [Sphingobium indicum]
MLNMRDGDWARFEERDIPGKFLDKEGRPATYAMLLERADKALRDHITPALLDERMRAAKRGVERIRAAIVASGIDTLIVIGDDQAELYTNDNLPSILIYYGETIRNNPRHKGNPNPLEWWQNARGGYYVDEGETDFPVDAGLARHMIARLVDDEFDISTANRLRDGEGEGHAFGFVHRQLMDEANPLPIVPLALNTYYAPNQPTPRRCYALGQAIRRAVESYPEDIKVGVIASGGLSHFVVDEELDRGLIEAIRTKDVAALTSMDRAKLNSGSSEIRNWIATAGACEHLDLAWSEYLPCYRTEAGTGTGVCFAEWH